MRDVDEVLRSTEFLRTTTGIDEISQRRVNIYAEFLEGRRSAKEEWGFRRPPLC